MVAVALAGTLVWPVGAASAGPAPTAIGGRVVQRAGIDGAVTFLGGARPLTPPDDGNEGEIAREFVEDHADEFGADGDGSQLVDEGTTPTTDGGGAVRFQQEIDGVPVLAGQIVVRVDEQGSVLSSAGEALPDTDVDTVPTIPPADALATAVALTAKTDGVDATALGGSTPELNIFDPELVGAPGAGSRLVWTVQVRTPIGDIDRLVFVDAHDGSVAFTFSTVRLVDSLVCDNGEQARATLDPALCGVAGGLPVVKSDSIGISNDTEVLSAYSLSKGVLAFYAGLGRNGIDGLGTPVRSTVHMCFTGGPAYCPYANAFWSGTQMVYGATYASADDVVGHELTHGVTQYESGLLYYAESGAINESLSDVFGELFDLSYNTGADLPAQRWLMGEDLPIGAIRDMENPPTYGDPDKMTSSLYWHNANDEYGVHSNSGVNNKAASLITDGGTFNGITMTGIGGAKTAFVYYEAQTSLLTAGSDYLDLYRALPQACANLVGQHGITATDCTTVAQAVTATEMNLDPSVTGGRLHVDDCPAGEVRLSTVYASDMEPAAQSGWVGTAGTGAWSFIDDSSQSGSWSLWGPDAATGTQTSATMAANVAIPSGNTYLKFAHTRSFDQSGNSAPFTYWDGGKVQLLINNSATATHISAAASATVNGYNGSLAVGNPKAGEQAFVGESPGYQESRYRLSVASGSLVKVRFAIYTDTFVGSSGWMIDDVEIYTCGAGAGVAPNAPTSPTAWPSGGSAFVTWQPPDDDGTGTITSYTVTPYIGAAAQTPVVTGSSAAYASVGGLTPGVGYTFKVAATTSVGTGAVSTLSNPVTLTTVPGAPTNVAATAGNRSASLTWAAPASNGGAAITGYVVTPIVNGVAGTPIATGSTVTSYTASSLTNGTSYTFTVTAVNAIGSGAASAASNAVVPQPTTFQAVSPKRVFDTRPGESPDAMRIVPKTPLSPGSPLQVAFAGLPGGLTPSTGLGAVSLNVAVTNAAAGGFVTVYPCGQRPFVASVNYAAGQTVSNAVIAPVSASGDVCFFASSAADVIVDINGWYPTGTAYTAVGPARVLDTRPGESPDALRSVAKAPVVPAAPLDVQVTGLPGGITPASGVGAVSLNVAVANPPRGGFITVFPCENRKLVASVNYAAGQTVSNAVIAPVSASGHVCFFASTATDLIVDINGWFPTGDSFHAVGPERVFDTRPGESPNALRTVPKVQVDPAAPLQVHLADLAGGVTPPSGVDAVSLNVAVTNPGTAGFVTVYPCGPRDLVASVNYTAGQTVSNAVVAPVSASGDVCFFVSSPADLIVDINGWFPTSA